LLIAMGFRRLYRDKFLNGLSNKNLYNYVGQLKLTL
jgi:hypothetical protein